MISVNELLHSLRESQVSVDQRGTSLTVTRTLPPQIRHILSLPETPGPKPRARDRRRYDANGRRMPAGPAPPRSWLEGPSHASHARNRRGDRLHPDDVNHLPGLDAVRNRPRPSQTTASSTNVRSLQDMCLRRMAFDWEFVREWERHNLADLPAGLKMLLLSNIAVYGPDDGIGFEGLKCMITSPGDESGEVQKDAADDNDGFYRLDLSGSVGRSVSLKQLTELVGNPVKEAREPVTDDSWEDSLMIPLAPGIPHLTHLSLSHPPSTISWPRLLQFSKHIPTLTHLSLAYWPVPSLTPNSTTAVMSSGFGRDLQYGGSNHYSISLGNDFREAASILRRLASALYGLQYIDLTGCTTWVWALVWKGEGEPGVEWKCQWLKMKEIKVRSGITLSENSDIFQASQYVMAFKEVSIVRLAMTRERRGAGNGGWVELIRDDHREIETLWKGSVDAVRKRAWLNTMNDLKTKEDLFHEEMLAAENEAPANSVWDSW